MIVNTSSRDNTEAIEWICRNQLQRTDLTNQMRRYLIGRQFLTLKLLGAHCAASAPRPDRNKASRKLKYDPSPVRIRETLGSLYQIRQETIDRYAAYTKAVDFTRTIAPSLAEGLLSGRYKLTFERTLELADRAPSEILELEKVLQNSTDPIGRDAAVTALFPPRQREPETAAVPLISVKNMPSYDPDAEISSLALTIPAWTKALQRVNQSSDFKIISDSAKKAARQELIRLKQAAEALLHNTKGSAAV